jgi:hypothetical protein
MPMLPQAGQDLAGVVGVPEGAHGFRARRPARSTGDQRKVSAEWIGLRHERLDRPRRPPSVQSIVPRHAVWRVDPVASPWRRVDPRTVGNEDIAIGSQQQGRRTSKVWRACGGSRPRQVPDFACLWRCGAWFAIGGPSRQGWSSEDRYKSVTMRLLHRLFALSVSLPFSVPSAQRGRQLKVGDKPQWHGVKHIQPSLTGFVRSSEEAE